MKNQALFSLKDKSKKLKCRLLQFLFGTLRVNFEHFFSLHTQEGLFVHSCFEFLKYRKTKLNLQLCRERCKNMVYLMPLELKLDMYKASDKQSF